MKYTPTVKNLIFGPQEVQIKTYREEVLQKVDVKWANAPGNVSVIVPGGYVLCGMLKNNDGFPLDLNENNEWKATLRDAHKYSIYCIASDLSSAANKYNVLSVPFTVNIITEENKTVPAKVSVRINYQLALWSGVNLARNATEASMDFSHLNDMVFKDICNTIKVELAPYINNKRLRHSEAVEIISAIEKDKARREALEKKINAKLSEKGVVLVDLSLELSDPFNDSDNNLWNQYEEDKRKADEHERAKAKLKRDKEILSEYKSNLETAESIRKASPKSDPKSDDDKKKSSGNFTDFIK